MPDINENSLLASLGVLYTRASCWHPGVALVQCETFVTCFPRFLISSFPFFLFFISFLLPLLSFFFVFLAG